MTDLERLAIVLLIMLTVLIIVTVYVHADDAETTSHTAGDDELQAVYIIGDNEGIPITNIIVQTGGGASAGPSPKFYDVISRVLKRTYTTRDENVSTFVQITYMGRFIPQNDGILRYEIVDPNGKVYPWKLEKIREGTTEKTLMYNLPPDPEVGQWQFKTTWIVPDLEPMTTVDVFNVRPAINPLYLIGVCILLAVIIAGIIVIKRRTA